MSLTRPGQAFHRPLRFIQKRYGHIDAVILDLLLKKRESIQIKKGMGSVTWFYYLNNRLLNDFGSAQVKSMRPIDAAIDRLKKDKILETRCQKDDKYGSVRQYLINDVVLKKLQNEFGGCWMNNDNLPDIDENLDEEIEDTFNGSLQNNQPSDSKKPLITVIKKIKNNEVEGEDLDSDPSFVPPSRQFKYLDLPD